MTETETYLLERVGNLACQIDQLTSEMRVRISSHDEELKRLEAIMDAAISKAVHELIEYLRYEDIQSLDEKEFAVEVKRLIWDADPQAYLPF